MGNCCSKFFLDEGLITIDLESQNVNYEEDVREEINNEKFIIKLKYDNNSNKIGVSKPEILLDVIHVDTINSTMPASEKYIDEGNASPFIYNTKIAVFKFFF